ncbi:MAG: hypothetical protein KAX20_08025 [Candidatus Omnitrophica bacterium]|nr:hypothetical protein [Candidatus Omnitrophota bacterium]
MAKWQDACKSCPVTLHDYERCEKPCLRAAQWAFAESMRELGRAIATELHLYGLVDWLERKLERR